MTSKIAKNTKGDITHQHIVSKPQFFTFIFAVLLHFCSCHVVHSTGYTWSPQFLRCSCSPASPYQVWY